MCSGAVARMPRCGPTCPFAAFSGSGAGPWASPVAQNEAAYVKILAERRAGSLLAQIERKPSGGRPGKENPSTLKAFLEEAGITESTAYRWQVMGVSSGVTSVPFRAASSNPIGGRLPVSPL